MGKEGPTQIFPSYTPKGELYAQTTIAMLRQLLPMRRSYRHNIFSLHFTTTIPHRQQLRNYSPPPSLLTEHAILTRVIQVLKTFNGVQNTDNIDTDSSFKNDLKLDSLDTVELMVALEEEFSIEIPDKVADKLKTVGETVAYIKNDTEAS